MDRDPSAPAPAPATAPRRVDPGLSVCTLEPLPPALHFKGSRLAVLENPANRASASPDAGGRVPRAHLIKGRLWSNGRALRVRFLDGDPDVHARVREAALTWTRHANLRFEFGDDPDAELRVTFAGLAARSLLGTDALADRAAPSMHLGGIGPATEPRVLERTVLHEFGHAIGLAHEHQHPAARIPWDRDAVYAYYEAALGWPPELVDRNVLAPSDPDDSVASEFDPRSIMLYAVPAELTLGGFAIGWNDRLSEVDAAFVGTVYPFPAPDAVALEVGGAAVSAEVGTASPVAAFRFVAARKATYTVSASGCPDVLLSLHADAAPGIPVATAERTGASTRVDLRVKLAAGAFTVRARHRRDGDSCRFRVRVRMQAIS